MKRSIIALALALTLSTTAQASGQKHRHHDDITATTTTVNDSSANEGSEGVVAYSDTTTVDTTTVATTGNGGYTIDIGGDDSQTINDIFGWLTGLLGGGFGIVVAILAVVVVLLVLLGPIIAIIVIIWLIVRNRNRRYRLAEKAMENGQQIPEELLRQQAVAESDLWRRGIRHVALGLGLVALFYCLGADPLVGIGWLVAFYGGGQAFIGWRDRKENELKDNEQETL